jgi:hypothetical protein
MTLKSRFDGLMALVLCQRSHQPTSLISMRVLMALMALMGQIPVGD